MVLAVVAVSCSSSSCGRNRDCSPRRTYTAGDACQGPRECIDCSDGRVRVSRSMPTEVTIGQDFSVCLTATATSNCTDVVVKETVPEGLEYISSEPPAQVNGQHLVWDLGDLQCGQTSQMRVTYMARNEGCYTSCYTVEAHPCCCQTILVGCPELRVCKTGDECVRLGCPVNYRIAVTNCGSQVAREVCLTECVPDELQHSSCCKELYYDLGNICPGETKCVDLSFCTCKCGRTVNRAVVQSCNCPPVTATATTMIQACCITLNKEGPAGPLVVGKDAEYTITAHNEGNIALNNVEVVDTVPPGARIKSAPGAQIYGNRAVWKINSIGADETMTFKLTMSTCTPGCLCNQATVSCCEEVGDCAEACTRWVGVAGLWLAVKATNNPICLGQETTYEICVQNQGFADDQNVQLAVDLPVELQPICAGGPGDYKIQGNTVVFKPIKTLHAGQTETFCVKVKAVKQGDARVKARLRSDLLKTPVTNEESTVVY